ncbi:hypothetical protein FGO68_gene6937 [Halteria grandinella]|uniref:FAD-dependent urate hydroxylase HpyO/Asp monooxygenase CreE-like FAD/NAD(P)-binding domain-containing protein n=1 Tax=Halteria grandinella TaxID=5974 RepID=A0A8J8NS23_HALGN|nr:hypothetical protein FGO68_gene6937 [Halteria grandinella]
MESRTDQPVKEVVYSIIGGGASSVCTLVSLVDAFKENPLAFKDKKINVLIFEKTSHKIGTGLPYQQDQASSNLMNDSANYISVKGYADPLHFMNWVKENVQKWGPQFPDIAKIVQSEQINPSGFFLPRCIVGQYVEDMYERTMKDVANIKNISVQIVRKEVKTITNVNPKESKVVTVDGSEYISDFIQFATGNQPNILYENLNGTPRYIPYHYLHEDKLTQILKTNTKKDLKILIIGTRLAGIDAAVLVQDQLSKNGNAPSYHVTITSRDGVLPMVRAPPLPGQIATLKYLNKEYINQIIAKNGDSFPLQEFRTLLEDQLTDVFKIKTTIEDLLASSKEGKQIEALKKELEMMSSGDAPWFMLRSGLLETLDNIWMKVKPQEKVQFLMMYLTPLLRIINAFPLTNVKTLIEMDSNQRLAVKGGLLKIDYSQSSNTYIAYFKASTSNTSGHTQEFDMVINACGVAHDVKSISTFYKDLSEKDLVNFTPFGSLDIDPTCFRMRSKVTDRIYAVGPPIFGGRLVVNIFIGIGTQTQLIVRDIMAKLQEEQSKTKELPKL